MAYYLNIVMHGYYLSFISHPDLLKKSSPSRIINVSSLAHKQCRLDLTDLNFDNRPFSMINAYGQSKLCNVLFTKELVNKLSGSGNII